MNTHSSRSMLQGLVGIYLLYLAYQLLKGLTGSIQTTMPRWVAILAIATFGGIGITFLVNAWKSWKKGKTDQDRNPVELEDENSKPDPENGSGESNS